MTTSDHSSRMLMACIGDASRFRLVQVLTDGARCVTDLAAEVGLSQSCTTRHLQALERRRVVCGTRDGKRVMYRLCHEEPALGPLLEWALSPDGVRAGMIPAGDGRVSAKSSTGPRRAARRTQPGRGGRRRAPGDRAAGKPPASSDAPDGSASPSTPGPPEPPASARPGRYELEDYLL
jgi:ArsR family transcriptional regulator